jgi:hypothetical protein
MAAHSRVTIPVVSHSQGGKMACYGVRLERDAPGSDEGKR